MVASCAREFAILRGPHLQEAFQISGLQDGARTASGLISQDRSHTISVANMTPTARRAGSRALQGLRQSVERPAAWARLVVVGDLDNDVSDFLFPLTTATRNS